MKRCTVSRRYCVFRSCHETKNMHRITKEVRSQVMKEHRFYIPNNVKVCDIHYRSRAWNNVNDFRQSNSFNKDQIEDMVDLIQFRPKYDVTLECSSDDMKILTGLRSEQFTELFECVSQLKKQFKYNIQLARTALYMYLIRLRTGQTLQQMSTTFNVSHGTIINRLRTVRNVLMKEFVPSNLTDWSRETLIANTTELSRILYSDGNSNRVVLILDGTYIFIEKSGNQQFQKQTYNDHKKRNYIKVMMCVTTNGKIVFASGPHMAVDNDAKILKNILKKKEGTILSNLEAGDICLVDRGFRDAVNDMKAMEIDVRIPKNIKKNPDGSTKKQLSTLDANLSRFVTKCRYAVEVRNGHMKCVWRLFKMVWTTKALPHVMADYQIGAALLNKFFRDLVADKQVTKEVASRMREKLRQPNEVQKIVMRPSFKNIARHFSLLNDYEFFPHLTRDDLFMIALGVYQIAQARNYCARHLSINNGQFSCFVCSQDICKKLFNSFHTEQSQLYFLLCQLLSRHISDKKYRTYLLIDAYKKGYESILGYYCECKNGMRVVGCCSHVMSIIWYFGYARRTGEIHKVSGFLDDFFHEQGDEDSSSDDELDSD